MQVHPAFADWLVEGNPWSDWAKPVAFTTGRDDLGPEPEPTAAPPPAPWLSALPRSAALVLDLPGPLAAELAPTLARAGWLPVPLYNGCPEPHGAQPLVATAAIRRALVAAASAIARSRPSTQAPPAFLLDFLRVHPVIPRRPGAYDNRWQVQEQDLPSGNVLRRGGIDEVVLIAPGVAGDLAHPLFAWQKAGVRLARMAPDGETAEPWQISRPSGWGGLFQRLMVICGLTPNSAGGFGGVVPQPSSGRSG